MNHFLSSIRSARFLCSLILLAIAFILLAIPAFMFGGVTWDELFDFEGVNGAFWHGINSLKGLNPDLSTITFDLEYFGNATRWPTYLLWRLLATSPWESFAGLSRTATILSGSYIGLNHLNAAVFGFLGIVLTSLIGHRLGGRKLAFLSAVFILILPTWLGHSWMNSKDIPFASSYLMYTYGSLLMLAPATGRSYTDLRGASFVFRLLGIGLLLGSRVGSIAFVVVSESVYLLLLKRAYLRAVISLCFGVLFGFLLTPQAWRNPIGYPIEAIQFIGNRQTSTSPFHTLSYIAFHLYESLPFLLVIGLVAALSSWPCIPSLRKKTLAWLPVIMQFLIAPALLIIGSKGIYNELRHILFIYPPLCLFSAAGWLHVYRHFSVRDSSPRIALVCGCSLALLLAVENIALSPYQYIYRSDLARILTPGEPIHRDYWGFSVRESIARCLKDKECKTLFSDDAIELRKEDWNSDLFDGLRELLRPPGAESAKPFSSAFQLQISPSRDACSSVVETTRTVLFPVPTRQLVSRIASCS